MHALGIREPSFLHSRRIAPIRRRPTTRSSGAGRGLARSQTLSSGGSGSRSSPAARSLYGRRGRRARPWRRGRSAGTRAHLPTSWRTGGWARSSRDIAEPSPRERGVTWRQCQCSTPPRRLRRSDSPALLPSAELLATQSRLRYGGMWGGYGEIWGETELPAVTLESCWLVVLL